MPRTRTIEIPLIAPPSEVELKQLAEGLADEDPGVREDCAQRIANLRNREAATYLRHALDDDEEGVRVWGAYGLGLLARSEDQGELQWAMREDTSPLVRLWATFGCAHFGDASCAHALVEMLDLPDLELRSNAVDALVTLADPSTLRPLLERRLESTDERRKVWAAAILHRWGHRGAFELWRECLLHPRSRVHAALVSPYLQSPHASRELVRVCAELSPEELEAPVPAANELPLAELLTSPLLELGLDEMLKNAGGDDAALRADLLLMVLRTPFADPEVVARVFDWAQQLPPEQLGEFLTEVLLEQSPAERLRLLSRTVDFAPDAVIPALERFEGTDRDSLFDHLAEAASSPTLSNSVLAPLLELLRTSPWSEQLADLPADPWASLDEGPSEELLDDEAQAELASLEDEEDLSPVIERIAAGEEVDPEERERAEALLADLGMTAEEFSIALNAEAQGMDPVEPPSPHQVALRTLCLAALVDRALRERALANGELSPAEAKSAAQAARSWLSSHEELDAALSAMERDLFDAAPGDWTSEDLSQSLAALEALAVLAWSIGPDAMTAPSPDEPTEPDALLESLPLYRKDDFEAFVERAAASQVDAELLDAQRELYETLLWRAEQEEVARRLLKGEEVELEIDEDAVFEELVADGMNPSELQTTPKPKLLAEGLRLLGRRAAQRLAEEGHLTLQAGDFAFRGKPLSKLDDALVVQLRQLAEQRYRALVWLGTGGDWDGLAAGSEEGPG